VVAGLAAEFGPAEVVDLFVRPVAWLAAAPCCPLPRAAVIAGKLAADVSFYLLAAPIYGLVRVRLHPRLEPVG